MATYKLIQDIEAEDKILGPLTLRQFIFALIAIFLGYMCFLVTSKGVPFLMAIFLPPALFFAFFALPWGRDQPTETWALAKLRYWFKPRRRIWNQSGIKEMVTITVPKKVEQPLTNGLSQIEVKSRLKALASTIDSRGWAIKNASAPTAYVPGGAAVSSDRLLDIDNVPTQVPAEEVPASNDILNTTTSNPIAQQFDSMIDQSSRVHRQELIDRLNGIQQEEAAGAGPAAPGANDNWFVGQNPQPPATAPVDPAADAQLSAQLAAQAGSQQAALSNLRTVQPAAPVPAPAADNSQPPPVTAPGDPAILSLAKNNDLNVSTLARQAQKNKGGDQQDEVVISLH